MTNLDKIVKLLERCSGVEWCDKCRVLAQCRGYFDIVVTPEDVSKPLYSESVKIFRQFREEKVMDKPIIMSAFSVKALLDGSKIQTRRLIRPQPKFTWTEFMPVITTETDLWNFYSPDNFDDCGDRRCPYHVGQRLWVRETFWNDSGDLYYKADYPLASGEEKPMNFDKAEWCSPIFMPGWASRITCEVTEIDVVKEDKGWCFAYTFKRVANEFCLV